MNTSVQSAAKPQLASAFRSAHQRKTEDLAYQAVTVAAILLVLGTVWLF
jgi:hypothetical protein